MYQMVEAQIAKAEDRLRAAMLGSDIAVLEDLLAPELIFTNHLGKLLGKEDDLAAHRTGILKLREMHPSEMRVQVHGEVVIVSLRMQIAGTYDGESANGDFRFTRVWALSPQKRWHIIAAHTGAVV